MLDETSGAPSGAGVGDGVTAASSGRITEEEDEEVVVDIMVSRSVENSNRRS